MSAHLRSACLFESRGLPCASAWICCVSSCRVLARRALTRQARAKPAPGSSARMARAQVGGQVQLAQQHGQVVGPVQGRQHVGGACRVRMARVRSMLAAAFLRQGRRRLTDGQCRIDQLAALGVGDDEATDGQARLQQAAGQGPQGADVAGLQGGRGGKAAYGSTVSTSTSISGLSMKSPPLRRLCAAMTWYFFDSDWQLRKRRRCVE